MAEVDDILRRYGDQPSTADVLDQMPPKPWGGLKSYLPDQPEWMKTAQSYAGRGMAGLNKLSDELPPGVFDIIMAGLLGPRARIPRPSSAPVAAATRYNGEIFTGPTHGETIHAALAKYPAAERFLLDTAEGQGAHGFVTPAGEFLTRAEALARADAAGWDITRGRNMGLDAVDLPAHIPRPPSLMQRLEEVPTPAPHSVLPSELPIRRRKANEGTPYEGEYWSVRSPSANPRDYDSFGSVEARSDPARRALFIETSGIPVEQRGQGIGLAMYQRLIDQAHKEGLNVYSDASVSPAAQQIYDALSRRGYQVQENPGRLGQDLNEPVFPKFLVRPPADRLPEIAEILKKYGIAGPAIMGPALAAVLGQYGDEAQ